MSKNAEPRGRDKKAIEKVANDSKVAMVASEPGKNNCGKTNTAKIGINIKIEKFDCGTY